jgi:hypothetical protein
LSGPKSSEYYLTLAESRRQEEERRIRLEQEMCDLLEREIEAKTRSLHQIMQQVELAAADLINEAKLTMQDSGLVKHIEQMLQWMQERAGNISAKPGVRTSTELGNYLAQVERIQQQLTVQEGTIQEALTVLNKLLKDERINRLESKLLTETKTLNPVQPYSFDLTMPVSQSSEPVQTTVDLAEALVEFIGLVDPFLNNELLGKMQEIAQLKKSVLDLAENQAVDDVYKWQQIKMRQKAFIATCHKYEQQLTNNQRLYQEYQMQQRTYHTVCQLLGETPKPYSFTLNEASQTLIDLTQEIKRCQSRLTKKEEAEYIAASINEVMAELGYEIVATDFLRTPKRDIIHHIYEFEQGNVVNVFSSDNGSLMFEVTGVKATNDLTELEKLKIKEGMESFCSKYDEIKKRLLSKGIEITAENLKSARIEYARAIDLQSKKPMRHKTKTTGGVKKPKQNQLTS